MYLLLQLKLWLTTYSFRAYFGKKKRPGFGRLLKKYPFQKNYFKFESSVKNNFRLGGTRPQLTILDYLGGILLKRKALFQEQFWFNSFHFK